MFKNSLSIPIYQVQIGSFKDLIEENRMILRRAMLKHGFKPLETEWWHFTLADEPYPNTYFDFPIRVQ